MGAFEGTEKLGIQNKFLNHDDFKQMVSLFFWQPDVLGKDEMSVERTNPKTNSRLQKENHIALN